MHDLRPRSWARDMLPEALRLPDWVAWGTAFLRPLDLVFQAFTSFYTDALDRAHTTSEIIRLERRLNRVFIGTWLPYPVGTPNPNQITFFRSAIQDTLAWYRRQDARPIPIYRRQDARPQPIYRRQDYAVRNSLIFLRVPISLQPREPEIVAEIKTYLAAGVTFTIIYY
jgi:hypothetical protein